MPGRDPARMPPLDMAAVRLLASVVEAGSFRAAAEAHRMSAANVSNRIGKLEKALGRQVLRRTTRRLEVTEEGRRLIALSERIDDELVHAQDELARFAGRYSGTLSIRIGKGIATGWIGRVLLAFKHDHPDLRLRIDMSGRDDGAEHDIAISRGASGAAHGAAHGVGAASRRAELVVLESCAAPEPAPCDVLALGTRAVCMLRESPDPVVLTACRAASPEAPCTVEVTPRFTATDPALVLKAVEQGVGIGVLPALALEAAGRPARVRRLFAGWRIEDGGEAVCIAVSARHRPKAAAVHLERLLLAAAGEHQHAAG